MSVSFAFALGLLGYTIFGIPLNFVGLPYERHLARRISPPRFTHHLEYRLWIVLLAFTQFAVLLLVMLGAAFWVDLFSIRPSGANPPPMYSPFPGAFGYFAGGLILIVLPMLAFGLWFDRRIRADGPEPPAYPAEVKALRRYLVVIVSVLVFLVAVVSLLMGAA